MYHQFGIRLCVSPLSKHYTDKYEIGRQVFEGFFGKLLFRIVNYQVRLKISLARSDEHDEKWTRPTSGLTRKYKWVSGFLSPVYICE